jgi:hypothetical protein
MGRDGRYDRSAFVPKRPPPPPQPRVFPPSPPFSAHPPPARWAERKRRAPACGLARLRRARISCRRGCACPAPLAPPACRRARSFRGRHALERAETAPSCHRPAGRGRQGSPVALDHSALFLRDAHAPVVVQIAICESERMSTPPHLAALARVRPSVRGRPR